MTESRPEQFFEEIVARLDAKQPFALATVVHTAGSTPQKAGARAIFLPDGRVLGTLGGGCMEAEARRRALELIGSGSFTTERGRSGATGAGPRGRHGEGKDLGSGSASPAPLLLDLHLDD